MLCSGTIIGTKSGMIDFLQILTNEFMNNNNKGLKKCKSPYTTDQWTMNYMYYNGMFGDPSRLYTFPWGVGPVLTVGKACMTVDRKRGAFDLITRNEEGYLVNHLDHQIAAVVHQHDRCGEWIQIELLQKYKHIYNN